MPSKPYADKPQVGSGSKGTDSNGAAGLTQERLRVAQLLHDTLAQELTGVYLLASVAAERCRTESAEAAGKLSEIADLVRQAGLNLAATVQELRGERAGRQEAEMQRNVEEAARQR